MLVGVHVFNPCSWLEVESSRVETHSFPHKRMPGWRFGIPIIWQINENGLMLAGPTNCMHQSKALVEQLISLNGCELNRQLWRDSLGLFEEESGCSFVSPHIYPFFWSYFCICQLYDVILVLKIMIVNMGGLFFLLFSAKSKGIS